MQVVKRLSANESTSKDIKSATKTLVQLTIMMSVANMISKVSKNGFHNATTLQIKSTLQQMLNTATSQKNL